MKRRTPKSTSNLTYGLGLNEEQLSANLAKSMVYVRTGEDKPSLTKSILNVLNGQGNDSVERLSFETDPTLNNTYSGVYRAKMRLIPDAMLKRIAIQDSLVSNIVRARQNHLSSFGRPREDRFSTGFVIKANTGELDKMSPEEKKEFNVQIDRAVKKLNLCGETTGLDMVTTFSEFLALQARNALVVGRIACEKVWIDDPDSPGKKKFHHFVAVDAGTIYDAAPSNQDSLESVRQDAYHLLCRITGKKLEKEKYEAGDYCYVQVVEGTPKQAFTAEEMSVYNCYPVPDVELDGYPVTPIDTIISAVTTHINLTQHNKLYFQSGRAARGMLVISSEDANPQVIHNIKQQFNASINSVNNSWRMPVFGCGVDESIDWKPIDTGGGKDMEFQYLCDLNAREILTAFMMSPDELPGWSYLSKGTNNQALSESNNEYKMTAARDVGIRPLLKNFEDFINQHLFPLIDPKLSKKASVRLVGLESDNAEKEAVRTQQDMSIWMNYDDISERVEKPPVGKAWGGTIPLNPVFKTYLDQYFTVGQILEHFCGREGASKDPNLAYVRDPFWFQWVQQQQAQQQAQMAQQQQAQGGGPPQDGGGGGGAPGGQPGGGGDPSQGPSAGGQNTPEPTQKQQSAASPDASGQGATGSGASDLARSIDIAFDALSKHEMQLPPDKRRLLAQHNKTVEHFMDGWEEDSKAAVKEILDVAAHFKKK